MFKKMILAGLSILLAVCLVSCRRKPVNKKQPAKAQQPAPAVPAKEYAVRLLTLDPGHFHAALVQKTMYDEISPTVYVYAPNGPDVEDHLNRIKGYNTRGENLTHWLEKVYTGDDYLEKMLAERKGNVVVISGNNKKKTQYISACVDAGLNVFADKPMCIDPAGFDILEAAIDKAGRNGVLVYDIMTERSEITTILQKKLIHNKAVFGDFIAGSADKPVVVEQSVHHFFKYVSGNPIKRPGWYFDTTQQGEGIVDVTTHLLDLVMWQCLPEQLIDYHRDIEIKKARRWPTLITKQQFSKVTRLDDFPDYLKTKLDGQGRLPCYANGEIIYKIKGIYAKVSVAWHYQAPKGGGDTHYSIMRGTKANIIIKQGAEQNYRPELYVQPAAGASADDLMPAIAKAVLDMQDKYPGVSLKEQDEQWHIQIPDKYRLGHEAHFRDVTERYLKYLKQHRLPEWEVDFIKAKYYTTTRALEMARR